MLVYAPPPDACLRPASRPCSGPFFREFDQMRWERFNSDKICLVTYARIQVCKNNSLVHVFYIREIGTDRMCKHELTLVHLFLRVAGPGAGQASARQPFPQLAPHAQT